jgi:Protein of unknown function (DUF3047)
MMRFARLLIVTVLLLLPSVSPLRARQQALSNDVKPSAPLVAGSFAAGLTPGGTPIGWKQRRIAGRTRFSIAKDGADAVLRVEATGGATGLFKEFRADPQQYPLVAWRWKIDRLIAAADERKKDKDDCAARLFVIFKDDLPGASRFSRLKQKLASTVSSAVPPGVAICYVWANRLNKDEAIASPYTDWVRVVAVESGAGRAGQWVAVERNVFEDFKKFFGKPPKQILGIAVMTDSDNTNQTAVAYYSDILFKPAP